MPRPANEVVLAATANKLRVLALEPYYGGSHRAFLDTWVRHSRHDWRLVTLPARHWKWRMRGSALWFAEQLQRDGDSDFDVLFTCDMTAVADLRALLPASLKHVPIVCCFHENQLTYPLAPDDWRDYQYAFTNITTALAADALWFNSQAHLDAFVTATGELLAKMPDHVPAKLPERIAQRAEIQYPAVEPPAGREARAFPSADRPLRILWCHRWEYDKNPGAFFGVLQQVRDAGGDFELVLLGEQFRTAPAVFDEAQRSFAAQIVHAGYLPTRDDYLALVATCDVVVSTAIQENFGIAVVESILAGCVPYLPNRLSYPEIIPEQFHKACIYPREDALTDRLIRAAGGDRGITPNEHRDLVGAVRSRFGASEQAARLDHALAAVPAPA